MMTRRTYTLLLGTLLSISATACTDKSSESDDSGSDASTGDNSTTGDPTTTTSTSGDPATSSSTTDPTGDATSGSTGSGDSGEMTMCDPVAQDCPAGEKCNYIPVSQSPTGDVANYCVPDVGDGVVGDPCSHNEDNSDSCAVGYVCWQYSLETLDGGSCYEYCAEGDCAGDEECVPINEGTLPICIEPCDPMVQDCDSGWGCYPQTDTLWTCLRNYATEATGATGAYGDPCPCGNCCAAGNFCADSMFVEASSCGDSPGCCTVLCDTSDPIDCPGTDEVCTPYYEAGNAPPGLENLGLCVIPQ